MGGNFMFKKVLITAIVATAVFAAGSAVYAQSETEYTGYRRDVAPVFELLSDKDESKTFESEYVISAIAKEGTVVNMNLYWFGTNENMSIIAKQKSAEDSAKEGNWILQGSGEVTVGASNIFAETVHLNLGKNRIVLHIKDINGYKAQRVLEIERFLKDQASKEVNGDTFNKFVENISNTANTNK
jgi:hypothetical protein